VIKRITEKTEEDREDSPEENKDEFFQRAGLEVNHFGDDLGNFYNDDLEKVGNMVK